MFNLTISVFKDFEKWLVSISNGLIIELWRNKKLQKYRIILSQHTNYLHIYTICMVSAARA